MGFLFCTNKKGKSKIHMIGDDINVMTMAAVISKLAAEKISKEKGIDLQKAMSLVIEGIVDSQDLLN